MYENIFFTKYYLGFMLLFVTIPCFKDYKNIVFCKDAYEYS